MKRFYFWIFFRLTHRIRRRQTQNSLRPGDRLGRHPWSAFFINHLPSVSLLLQAMSFFGRGKLRGWRWVNSTHVDLCSALTCGFPVRLRSMPPTSRKLLKDPMIGETILIRHNLHASCSQHREQASRQEKSFRSSPSPYLVDGKKSIHRGGAHGKKLFHFSSSAIFIEPDLLPECTYWRRNEWEI